jgi:hypothetical protein
MKVWFEDPKQLVKNKRILDFWPTSKQTPAERINAASRFIIYATCILFVIRRDPRMFILGATMLSVIYVMYKANLIKEPYGTTEKMKRVSKTHEREPSRKCSHDGLYRRTQPSGSVLLRDRSVFDKEIQ